MSVKTHKILSKFTQIITYKTNLALVNKRIDNQDKLGKQEYTVLK